MIDNYDTEERIAIMIYEGGLTEKQAFDAIVKLDDKKNLQTRISNLQKKQLIKIKIHKKTDTAILAGGKDE